MTLSAAECGFLAMGTAYQQGRAQIVGECGFLVLFQIVTEVEEIVPKQEGSLTRVSPLELAMT